MTAATTPDDGGGSAAEASVSTTVRTMVPPRSALPDVLPNDRLNDRGMPIRELRDELRRIPNARNVIAVLGT